MNNAESEEQEDKLNTDKADIHGRIYSSSNQQGHDGCKNNLSPKTPVDGNPTDVVN